jgi:hypothetical protein
MFDCTFSGDILIWRGPAPYLFVAVPDEAGRTIRACAAQLSYGWGVVPCIVTLGATEWRTSLMPKDGRYLVPIRVSVQRAELVGPGMTVTLRLRAVGSD